MLQGLNLLNGMSDNETETATLGENDAYNVGADLILRHRFLKEGRTLSLMLSGKMSNTDGNTYTDYLNTLYSADGLSETDSYSQWKQTLNRQYTLRSNLSYTERLTDYMQLQLGYKLSYTDSENDRKTYKKSAVSDLYDQLDESLSNEYQSGYLTQAGSVGLRYRAGKFNAMLGVDAQWADLRGLSAGRQFVAQVFFYIAIVYHALFFRSDQFATAYVIAANHLLLRLRACRML